jgi:hypothetical protein
VTQENDPKADVKKAIDELRELAKSYTMDDIKEGTWFTSLLRYSLETYAKKANAAYFRAKYPGLPADAVVDRQVDLARQYSALEGALSAAAYTAAVAATIGSGGGASPLTVPGAVGSFVIDLMFTTQIQLRLAHDIAVIYDFPVDLEDPEDLLDLMRVAFGIKAGEALRSAAAKGAPEAVRQGVKAVIKGPVLALLKGLPVIGKYLLQRNIIKFAIPVIGVPLSAGMNYWTTGSIGTRAKDIFRHKASVRESAAHMHTALRDDPSLLFRVVWMVVQADEKVEAAEASLLRELIEQFRSAGTADAAIADFEALINLNQQQVFAEIGALPGSVKAELYRAACVAAAVDREIHAKELDVLRTLAGACGVVFDEKEIRRLAKV